MMIHKLHVRSAAGFIAWIVVLLLPAGLVLSAEDGVTQIGSLIRVRPEYEERYIILHKYTFPAVLQQIHNSNIRNYSIFLLNGVLFSHFEYAGKDFKGDMDRMALDRTTRDWWKLTEPMQEPFENRKEGEWWTVIDKVFHLDNRQRPSEQAHRFSFLIQTVPGKEEECVNHISRMPQVVIDRISGMSLQNISVFNRDGRLYCYLEYFGNDLLSEIDVLLRDENLRVWRDGLKGKVSEGNATGIGRWWQPMEEVFHTN